MRAFSLLRLIVLATAVSGLAGCGGDPSLVYAQAFGFQCSQANDAAARTLCRKPSGPQAAEVSRYCYQTIGDANCFDRPDPDSKNQALGSSGY